MVTSGAAPLGVSACRRVRRSTSTDAIPDRQPRTRRSAPTIGGGIPDMTSKRAVADQAGARPYLRRSVEMRSRHPVHVERLFDPGLRGIRPNYLTFCLESCAFRR